MSDMPTTDELETLMGVLCVELGFCLHGDKYDQLVDSPPADATAFADAVFRAQGMNPSTNQQLFRQVQFRVAQVFDSKD